MFDNNHLQRIAKKPFYPDLKQSWFLVLFLLPALFFSSALREILKGIDIDNNVIHLITYSVKLGIIVLIAFIFKKNINDRPFVYYKSKVSAWTYVLVIPAIIGLSGFVDIAGVMILPEMPDYLKESLGNAMNSNLPTILTAVVAAPVLEEIICRGIICEGLIKNISPRAGILWSAFIFAVIHLNPWQGFSAFVVGCFFGWIYWKTLSIIPCIFMHFINNGLVLFLYYYHCEKLGYDLDTPIAEIYGFNEIILMLIYAAIFLASFVLLVRIFKSKRMRQTNV
ncbi:MAG: CPBP family intramembrane metalloprotease [Prevotellaceae bacterium]|jgi:membrane protease YdiL (CAAX protease family)|nr:CPBP family intramembrane metalloprotease [Prevotellaceae bacterium]